MTKDQKRTIEKPAARRLSKADRRSQLLDTALMIIREEGADRLSLGHLAARAGVSKPVAYDHFATRSDLLIELYKTIDARQVSALREALINDVQSFEEIVTVLAGTYIHCSADTSGEWHSVGAALAGSDKMEAVYQELIDGYVQLFVSVLEPYSSLLPGDLERCCVGLVGAGEALAAAMVRGNHSEADTAKTFSLMIMGGCASRITVNRRQKLRQ